MSTSTRPPLRPSRPRDGGGQVPVRTYKPANSSDRLRLIALIVAFILTVFAARLVDARLAVVDALPPEVLVVVQDAAGFAPGRAARAAATR